MNPVRSLFAAVSNALTEPIVPSVIREIKEELTEALSGMGTMVNSGFMNGMDIKEAKEAMIKHLEEEDITDGDK